jgi:poly-gamma-glutamate capsule biosynthesis protein CapA/YwtB (metallophosphatase superfamily)
MAHFIRRRFGISYFQLAILAGLLFFAAILIFTHPVNQKYSSSRETSQVSPSVQPDGIHLSFVGDIMLSRSVGEYMARTDDWYWPFHHIGSATQDPELMFGNLETTISDRGTQGGCGFCFRSDPRVAVSLARAGFDVLSIANNHIWDYGEVAFSDTLQYLAAEDISAVGGGRNLEEARGPVIHEVQGVRIAYLASTDILPASAGATAERPGANIYDVERMASDIREARRQADIVVVSFHTGEEYQPANDHQRSLYHSLIDVGADIVVGHHPHVVQEIEQYNGGWIAYSLGNFIFDQNFSKQTMTGLMLDVSIKDNKIFDVTPRVISISPQYQPSLSP